VPSLVQKTVLQGCSRAPCCRYDFQLSLGRKLAKRVLERNWDIDCIVPVPDGSRPAAIELSAALGLPYREGLVKNRYVGRTFIMPNQKIRELSVRRKLNAMPAVFAGKRVLLVDDSIVRGTTMSQIVDMVRKAGASKVYLASASPPVKFPNVYGARQMCNCQSSPPHHVNGTAPMCVFSR
jgi:amidophosphoribosyltransferase